MSILLQKLSFGRNLSFKTLLLLILTFFAISNPAFAQKKVGAGGFLEYMNTTWIPDKGLKSYGFDSWQMENAIYNRINLSWTPVKDLEFHAGVRNNFVFGPMVSTYNTFFESAGTNYSKLLTQDDGYMDLTWKISGDNSNVLYTNVDRLYFQYTISKFELTVGRQRINWGKNLVWTPNDIFNAFNYFDFNYIERPGSDAVLLQYYTGAFSSVQVASKLSYRSETIDSLTTEKKLSLTSAAIYKFNKWNYDFQFFAGNMVTDITAGLGWSGNIGGAGFSGEVSWFRDRENFSDTTGVVIASLSGNYVFKNQISADVSFIFNSDGSMGLAWESSSLFGNAFSNMFSSSLNVKSLTPSRLDLFAQLSYPATPLINVTFSGIYNPWDNSAYVSPNVTISLTENINLMLLGQIFTGKQQSEFGDIGQMYFLDLKWSF